MGVSLLNFFDLKPLNTSKRALNTSPPFFWDTLYIRVLDFGCGTGETTRNIAMGLTSLGKPKEVLGVDIREGLLRGQFTKEITTIALYTNSLIAKSLIQSFILKGWLGRGLVLLSTGHFNL